MCNKTSIGPSTVPCGTPRLRPHSWMTYHLPQPFVSCILESSKACSEYFHPYLYLILLRRASYDTVSNAFEKSRIATSLTYFFRFCDSAKVPSHET